VIPYGMQVPVAMWQCYTEEVEELLRLDTLLRFNLGNGPSQPPGSCYREHHLGGRAYIQSETSVMMEYSPCHDYTVFGIFWELFASGKTFRSGASISTRTLSRNSTTSEVS